MQDKIIEILRSAHGYVSGSEISEKLGVSRQAVWKAINLLKEQGYEFDSVRNKGYRILRAPDCISEMELKRCLNTRIIGKNLVVLDSVGSTNDYLKRLAAEGAPNGTVVTAREQTKGKGRLGRSWQTAKDEGIAFSVLLRPDITPSEVSAITPLAGLAVCKAIREYTSLECMIKWPNDIIVGQKKLVGILTEMSAEFDAVQYVIIGIGINVEHTHFPEEIAYKATSLLLETGRHINKNEFLACVLKHIEDEFTADNLELTPGAVSEYTDLCATVGKNITFMRGTRRVSGAAVGITSRGELEAMMSDGTICTINSGEVTVQGIY